MGNNAIIRYATQICCLSDFFLTGNMSRHAPEELTAQQCVKAICALGTKCLQETEFKDAKSAWSTYSNGKEKISNEVILSIANEWNFKTAIFEYGSTKYDLLAVQKLKQIYIANGGNMYEMEQKLGIYRWILVGAMEYEDRIPRVLRNVLTRHLENLGDEPTWEDLRKEMDLLKENPKMYKDS